MTETIIAPITPEWKALVLECALLYIAHGWKVFPLHSISNDGECTCGVLQCKEAGKHPREELAPHGFKNASREEEKIRAWFGKDAAVSNIALRTGKESGCMGADVDQIATWVELTSERGDPDTLVAQTGSGGMHFFFQHQFGIKTSSNTFGPGIDCRSDNGYLILPPSRHRSGKEYEWLNEEKIPLHDLLAKPLAQLPEFLVQAAAAQKDVARGKKAQQKFSLEQVAAMLEKIPADDRDRWRNVGVILGREFNRSDEAWDAYVAWSGKWGGKEGRHHKEIMEEAFHVISQQPATKELSMGTLVELARNHGWDESGLPVVMIAPGSIDRNAHQIADLMAAHKAYFRREGILVRAEHLLDDSNEAGVQRKSGAVMLRTASLQRLRADVSKVMVLRKNDGRMNASVPVDLPDALGASLIAMAPDFRQLPNVLGISCVPIMRELDCSLVITPGHDAKTGLIFDARGADFAGLDVPRRPTGADVAQALELLLTPLRDFAFADGASRSVTLAAMLTAAVRALLITAPAFGFSAPAFGSGKTLLSECIGIMATGKIPSVITMGEKAELDKAVDSVLLSADPVVLIDNISEPIGGDKISAAMTADRVKIRLFHTQTQQEVPNRALWMFTGVNLTVRQDMVRRTLIAEIDANVERPELRGNFAIPNLKHWVAVSRVRLLASAFTILRAHQQAAPKPPPEYKPLGSFEQWSRLVVEPLLWLGEENPMKRQEQALEDDPIRQRDEAIFAALFAMFEWREFMASQVAKEFNDHNNMNLGADALQSFVKHGMLEANHLGNWLRGRKGKIIGGRKLVAVGRTEGMTRFAFFSTQAR